MKTTIFLCLVDITLIRLKIYVVVHKEKVILSGLEYVKLKKILYMNSRFFFLSLYLQAETFMLILKGNC